MAVLQLLSVFTAKHSRGESPNSNQSLSLCVSGTCGVYMCMLKCSNTPKHCTQSYIRMVYHYSHTLSTTV